MSENLQKQTNGIKLSKSTMLWVFVGLALSSSIVVVISLYSGVTISNFASFGYAPFLLAGGLSSLRLLVQVLRYRVAVFGLSGVPKSNFKGLSLVRVGSEFVSLTTPSLIGGVVVRAAWLTQKGVDSGKAFWIAYFEVLMDVYIGSAFALVASIYAFLKGATIIGSTIAAIVAFQLVFYTVIFLIPALRGLPLFPQRLIKLAEYFMGGTKAKVLEAKINQATKTFSLSARSILKKDALPIILKASALTMVDALLLGLVLWIILTRFGLSISVPLSVVVSFGVSTIAIIPISIGGSGVAEFAMHSFLSSVLNFNSWTAVLIWRIVSFQFLLIPTGIAFAFLMRKTIWAKITQSSNAVDDSLYLDRKKV
ncbi:MAG: flippase-like domain-containing protein [Thaumarchaeota archaeon]|nr:flippase-like domain-containing protein [Nitrososphaerota archaeon]